MREILFRGERVDNKRWVQGYLSFVYWDVPEKACIYSPDEVRRFDVITETIGQYTGLTDKNGVKIFEGDIIHGKLGNFAVRWSEYIGAFVAGISTKIMPCLNRGTMKCYEVVGNIYDNPELLESDIHKAETAESE